MKSLLAALALLLASVPTFAADLDGNWSGSLETPQGSFPVQYTFKTDGKVLNGTTLGPDGKSLAIKGGKVDGQKISFSVDMEFGGNAMTVTYSGVIADSEIKMHMDFMGMPMDYIIKKS